MLDETDMRLLKLLQGEGRMRNRELATQCNLSPSACHERFHKLRKDGYIKAIAPMLAAEKLERALLVFVEVLLHNNDEASQSGFARAAHRCSDVMECHLVAGRFDFLIKVRVKDMFAYQRFLRETLAKMPEVRETRTYAVLEEVKNTVELPL